MAREDEPEESVLDITVKFKTKKKSGFQVELRHDGYYYMKKVPKGHKSIGVGDRVLEINGTRYWDFNGEQHANDLFDTFRLEIAEVDEFDEDEASSEGESYSEAEDIKQRAQRQTAISTGRGGLGGAGRYDDDEGHGDSHRGGSSGRRRSDADNTDDDIGNDLEAFSGSDAGDDGYDETGSSVNEDDGSYDGEGSHDREVVIDITGSPGKEEDPEPLEDKEQIHQQAAMRTEAEVKHPTDEQWERPYTSDYQPNDRFMITVAMPDDIEDVFEDVGLQIVKFKKDLYVYEVEKGPFYSTAIDRGDKILSINGKKVQKQIQTVEDAEDIIASKKKVTVFVMRPDPRDKGYQWVMQS